MFAKQLPIGKDQQQQQQVQSTGEAGEKETQYEQDIYQQLQDITIIDKEITSNYQEKKAEQDGGFFPRINNRKETERNKKKKVAGEREEKLPQLSKDQEKIQKTNEKAQEKQTGSMIQTRSHQPAEQADKNTQISISNVAKIEQNQKKVQQPSIQKPQPQQIPQQQNPIPSPKLLQTSPQTVTSFDPSSKSPTILFENVEHTSAFQSSNYYQNNKLLLSQPITSLNASCRFRIENIKYCVGFGIGLKQVLQKHDYNYQSQGPNQLEHGLYIVTSQGYSWSHSQKQQDDILRPGFNCMYNGMVVDVGLRGDELEFRWKKGQFRMNVPMEVREKYTVCFCGYLHEKSDAISITK